MEIASFFFLAHFRHADFKIKTMYICPTATVSSIYLVNACFPVGDSENVPCAFNELYCLLRPLELLLPKKGFNILKHRCLLCLC